MTDQLRKAASKLYDPGEGFAELHHTARWKFSHVQLTRIAMGLVMFFLICSSIYMFLFRPQWGLWNLLVSTYSTWRLIRAAGLKKSGRTDLPFNLDDWLQEALRMYQCWAAIATLTPIIFYTTIWKVDQLCTLAMLGSSASRNNQFSVRADGTLISQHSVQTELKMQYQEECFDLLSDPEATDRDWEQYETAADWRWPFWQLCILTPLACFLIEFFLLSKFKIRPFNIQVFTIAVLFFLRCGIYQMGLNQPVYLGSLDFTNFIEEGLLFVMYLFVGQMVILFLWYGAHELRNKYCFRHDHEGVKEPLLQN